ncbi:phage terminase small subunit P27 family [Peptostreptococcus sp. D1]|uniref:phage terminase small subunit P27 family n=1 Tax=Peptostreptococcus sp. D1 TaxID=72304 RepID=UPI0008E63E1C|nr:phage terminase small subunit P27 family [Peptostreptococcus sp. D1]SFE84230.1 phage terminase, small subunit, putative, P27 family [Peptostreptococcus sp. D1]
MGRNKQPIELVIAKGNKHLTKDEIKFRRDSEIKPITDGIEAPSYLTKKQKEQFDKLAEKLGKLKIMGETDIDALARYIISNDFYLNVVKQLRKKEVMNDADKSWKWSAMMDRYFKQCRTSASDLGLTISSRCKLVVPEINKEAPKENKFKKFEKTSGT